MHFDIIDYTIVVVRYSSAPARGKNIRPELESTKWIDEMRVILRGLIDHISVAREKKSAVVEGEIFFYVLDDDKFVSMRERPW